MSRPVVFMNSGLWGALVAWTFGCLVACGATTEPQRSPNRASVQPAAFRDRRAPPAPERGDGPHVTAVGHSASCEPGDSEICGCPGAISGVRRCNEAGTALGACDACANQLTCGDRRCESIRVQLLEATLAPCCPRAGHCGVDVSYFAQNHDLAMGCLELEAPGTTDPGCPSVSIALPVGDAKTIVLAGCRTRSGTCGYDVNLPGIVNLGCTEPPKKASR